MIIEKNIFTLEKRQEKHRVDDSKEAIWTSTKNYFTITMACYQPLNLFTVSLANDKSHNLFIHYLPGNLVQVVSLKNQSVQQQAGNS